MGLLDNLINGMIGAFGIKKRSRPFDPSRNAEFVPALRPGTIILQWPREAEFVGGLIQGATDSVITHVVGFAGFKGGHLIRDARPELMARKNNPIPRTVLADECFEATFPVCRVFSLSEQLTDKIQMIAFCFYDLTVFELIDILCYAYSKNGTPYDLPEFFSDAFPYFGITHPPANHVCSSLWSTAHAMAGLSIVRPDVNPLNSKPCDINRALYPRKSIPIATWNWNPGGKA